MLHFDTEKDPYEISNSEGEHRYSEAERRHLSEPALEREVLCHGDVEVEDQYDEYGDGNGDSQDPRYEEKLEYLPPVRADLPVSMSLSTPGRFEKPNYPLCSQASCRCRDEALLPVRLVTA